MRNVLSLAEQGALLSCIEQALRCFRLCFGPDSQTAGSVPSVIFGLSEAILSADLPFQVEFNRPRQHGFLEPLCEVCLELCKLHTNLRAFVCKEIHHAQLWSAPHPGYTPYVLELLAEVSSYAHMEGLTMTVCAKMQDLPPFSQAAISELLHDSANESGICALLLGASWLEAIATASSSVTHHQFPTTF